MSPEVVKLIVWAAIALVLFSVISTIIPIALFGWGAMLLANIELKRLESIELSAFMLAENSWKFKNKQAMGVLGGFIGLGFMIFSASAQVWIGFTYLVRGDSDGIVTLLLGVLAILAIFIICKLVLRRYDVKDFFTKASDRAALDIFFEGEAKPVVIDPVELADYCKSQVIGQDTVIVEVAKTTSRRAKLNRKGKPLGVFLFVGPTGVGKTELGKALADGAFEGRLIRFDMAEFTESHTSQRLVGAPPGYTGCENGGALTQAIKTKGNGVILFDEVEKAHPDIIKMLLGLMDEGRITDASFNETVDASKFIIILTSNAAHRELGELAKSISDPDDLRRAVKDTLVKQFPAEILGRIDETFPFKPLDRRGIASIVVKHLQKLEEQVGVEIQEFDSELLISSVMRHEKQADYGIRELIRLVEKSVVDGMIDCKEMGYELVKIECDSDVITVRGVESPDHFPDDSEDEFQDLDEEESQDSKTSISASTLYRSTSIKK